MADERPIIIKKIKKVEGGGHHGGAWKVAYADFVTAMMAFFLLMWLLGAASDEQLAGLADYFAPISVSLNSHGSGGVMGGLSLSPDGALVSTADPMGVTETYESAEDLEVVDEEQKLAEDMLEKGKITENQFEKLVQEQEQKRFAEAEKQIRQALEDAPEELKALASNLLVDRTPEGLRIQIVDQAGTSMFPLGSSKMYDKTEQLLTMVSGVIKKMPNKISIRGHTDGVQYSPTATYNNWDLSADRANASRRALILSGVNPDKFYNVVGKADTEHLYTDDPLSPQNRRISIVLLSEQKMKEEEKENKALSSTVSGSKEKDEIAPKSYLGNR